MRSWTERVGAAIVAPAQAMAASDSPEGRGRASSDIALLLLLAVSAVETELFATSAWMIRDGDWLGALTVLVVGFKTHLVMPIVLLLVGTVVLSLVAGKKRAIADDFDLVSVALVPVVALELVHALCVALFGVDWHQVVQLGAYAWAVGLLVLAYRQTGKRG